MLTLRYELSTDDILNFNCANWKAPFNADVRTKGMLNELLIAAMAGLAWAGLLSFLLNKPIDMRHVGLVGGAVVIVVLIYYFVLPQLMFRGKTRRFLADPANRGVLLPNELFIDENSIRNADALSDVTYKWEAISKSYETQNYFLLYINSIQALIIPKRILGAHEQVFLQNLLRQKINGDNIFTSK